MLNRLLTRRHTMRLLAAGAGALLARTGWTGPKAPTDGGSGGFDALQQGIRGSVTAKGDGEFDAARRAMVWNQRVAGARVPEAIVQVASAEDVVTAVDFARRKGLQIAVRGSGHNYHGAVLRNGGLLLDLSRLKTFTVDPEHRRASVGPALKGGELMAALAPHGLAFPVGHCSDVPLSGYVLNGGFGWNFGDWGPACMSVQGMQLVTAAGKIVYASESENADLLWAARGAGPGFFAIATRYDLALQALPSAIRTYAATFPLEVAPVIAKWLTAVLPAVHPTVEVVCSLGPIDETGTPVIGVLGVALASSQREAIARLGGLRDLPADAARIGEIVDQPATFEDLFALVDATFPGGKRMAGDQCWSKGTVEDLIMASWRLAPDAPPAPSAITIVALGGNAKTKPYDAALSVGGGTFLGTYAFWDDPARDRAGTSWVRSVMAKAEPFRDGAYIGEADLSANPGRLRECFSQHAWSRLAALKLKYDPDDLFYRYLTTTPRAQ
jgi:FAD/FMN-containing dehydrogenase